MISNTLPQSLIDNPILSQWIAFEEKGRVRVGSGKVEIGQGILTALTQIAAEELDVGFEQVQSRLRPDRRQSGRGFHLRQLFGRGRRRFDPAGLRRGALAVPRSRRGATRLPGERAFDRGRTIPARRKGHRPRLLVDGGRHRARPPRQRHRAGEAAIDLPDRRQHLPRLDLPAKVAGAAFIHDIAPDGVVHARVLRQPWRGARLVELDESAVRKAAKAPSTSCARAISSPSPRRAKSP